MIFSKQKQTNSKLVKVFGALGDKTRYQLLKILSQEKEICVSELAQRIGISNAGVSQQLKVLESAGLIERQRSGQKICYVCKTDDEVNRRLFKLMEKDN